MMKLQSPNGYDIYYNESFPNDCHTIIIAMHGFAGDKESSCIAKLENELKKINVGLIKFDWPAHGSSNTNDLSISNCLSDLNTIINYVKNKKRNCSLIAFATSFGGYLTLLYNYYYPNTFKHIILRSPALNMHSILTKNLLNETYNTELETQGYFTYGFERLMNVSSEFIDELKKLDINSLYQQQEMNYISIIHGTNDDIVPITDSISFANIHHCSIYKIKGADHRYKKDGEIDQVIQISTDIIKSLKSNNMHLYDR